MQWDEPWWSNDTVAFNLIHQEDCSGDKTTSEPKNSRLSRIFDDVFTHESHPNVLLAWIGGEDPEVMEAASEQELIQAATDAFRSFTGRPIPPPSKLIR